ncbi:McrB family protein [Chitinophaga agri]|uniref:AAA domain-containing protein n=1 Tax=Chitinophaga agri TaxID=2703787 RepID=A0A6B9ZFI6_9BACT|nr:AAA family ATPase [Chitinophaga agri]QHS60816.1 AAA domain-containing protein [Chitinophaga agri]
MKNFPGQNTTAFIRNRRHRYRAIQDDGEDFNINSDNESNIQSNLNTADDVGKRKKRKSKKGAKSGMSFSPTFPNIIDFNHPYRQILMAIKTKPFVLMAGMCGTGKSRFARTFAYQTCPKYLQEDGQPGNFQMIQVQPDWHDADGILGWLNTISGHYQWTPFLIFLVKAWRHLDTPFILCLDEMNLAKVELYFANFLSILESRQWINGELVSDAFITPEKMKYYAERDPDIWVRLGIKIDIELQNRFLKNGIMLPPNLAVIGTANIDLSGEMFSMKLLDRMMVIELTEIDFYGGIKSDDVDFKFPEVPIKIDQVLGKILNGKDAYLLFPKIGDLIISELQSIDKILTGSSIRFGYRVRDAALTYCAYNSQLADYPKDNEAVYRCLDELLLMKVLPRINVDRKAQEKLIANLLRFAKDKYPRTYLRIQFMLDDLSEFSYFISFWQRS